MDSGWSTPEEYNWARNQNKNPIKATEMLGGENVKRYKQYGISRTDEMEEMLRRVTNPRRSEMGTPRNIDLLKDGARYKEHRSDLGLFKQKEHPKEGTDKNLRSRIWPMAINEQGFRELLPSKDIEAVFTSAKEAEQSDKREFVGPQSNKWKRIEKDSDFDAIRENQIWKGTQGLTA